MKLFTFTHHVRSSFRNSRGEPQIAQRFPGKLAPALTVTSGRTKDLKLSLQLAGTKVLVKKPY